MVQHDDPPTATFRRLYALLPWGGLIAMALILTWLLWTLFTTTSAGTARSQELALVRPTVTAIAAAYAGTQLDDGAVVAVDLPATCAVCHALKGTSAKGVAGPELTHIGSVSVTRVADADYTGEATDPAEYIRESILDPDVYVVPGAGHGEPGSSIMPAATGTALAQRELDNLVRYLASLE